MPKETQITKEQFDRIVDALLKRHTVKIYSPLNEYDYHKVVISIEELYKFINDVITEKDIDWTIKQEINQKICDELYPHFTQEQINMISKTVESVLNLYKI